MSVFLPGGADLLDTLAPLDEFGRYADLRRVAQDRGAAALGPADLALHPALAPAYGGGVKGLFDGGQDRLPAGHRLRQPDLSHFHSATSGRPGWSRTTPPAAGSAATWTVNGSGDNPLQGVSMSNALSPVLRTGRAPVAAVSSPNDAQLWIPHVWGTFDDAMAMRAQIAQRAAQSPRRARLRSRPRA